jgi:hypothetical protein
VITSKSVSKDGGRTGTAGSSASSPDAHHAKSNVRCDALILDDESRSDTYPYIEVEDETAPLGHEATVSKVGEDQLFYLMSRGLSEVEATAMIVNGFIEPITRELPMEYAVELNRLIELQMEGSVGSERAARRTSSAHVGVRIRPFDRIPADDGRPTSTTRVRAAANAAAASSAAQARLRGVPRPPDPVAGDGGVAVHRPLGRSFDLDVVPGSRPRDERPRSGGPGSASCDLDRRAPRVPCRTSSTGTSTAWCRRSRHQVHRAPRALPDRAARSSTSRATSRSSCRCRRVTYLDDDGAAVFPHTLLIADEGADVTFIDRITLAGPRPRALRRGPRDRRRATARTSGTSRSRSGGRA